MLISRKFLIFTRKCRVSGLPSNTSVRFWLGVVPRSWVKNGTIPHFRCCCRNDPAILSRFCLTACMFRLRSLPGGLTKGGECEKVLTILAATILAALTVLTGCGGGGGGGSIPTPVVMPDSPEMENIPEPSGFENVAGVDIRDTWKSTEPIKSYFGLEGGGSLSRFEGLDASGYSVLGSKDGITYAQRMSGPTDTIDIDFIGGFDGYFDSLPDHVRGTIERAGKAWSHRLKDILGPFMSDDSVVTRKGLDEHGYIRSRVWWTGFFLILKLISRIPILIMNGAIPAGFIGTNRWWGRILRSGPAGLRWRQ